jgi:hypothetical protein
MGIDHAGANLLFCPHRLHVAWGVVTGNLILPELRRRGRNEALRPLLMFHSFRFVGLALLVPGVVSPDLPTASEI